MEVLAIFCRIVIALQVNNPVLYIKSQDNNLIKLESNTFLLGGIMPEVTKMTSKGQVVIPAEIRQELDLEEGTQMVVSRMGDLVLMKKISIIDPKKEFEELTKRGSAFAKKKGIKSEDDVMKRIQRGRGVKSD